MKGLSANVEEGRAEREGCRVGAGRGGEVISIKVSTHVRGLSRRDKMTVLLIKKVTICIYD